MQPLRILFIPEEASADLGATGFQTFRYVTFPVVRTAIVAGALLAFALTWLIPALPLRDSVELTPEVPPTAEPVTPHT